MGDPTKEVERLEVVAKRREEAEEEADYRAVERGHVSATSGGGAMALAEQALFRAKGCWVVCRESGN